MRDPSEFQPAPFQVVSDLAQLKAFTDPLRARILHILQNREATNQQVAAIVGEPQAKVLHHVRVLLKADLIRLVEERVRGGNVEKYYRATARVYGFRPDPAEANEMAGPVSAAGLISVAQELEASLRTWPEQPFYHEGRRTRMSAQRLAEFNDRMLALIGEYWGNPEEPVVEDDEDDVMAMVMAMYRFPGEA